MFIVVHGTSTPRPPFRDACLAGAWPIPAESTLPRITYYTYFGFSFIESKAPFMAMPPSYGACRWDSFPMNAPIGVLFAATI